THDHGVVNLGRTYDVHGLSFRVLPQRTRPRTSSARVNRHFALYRFGMGCVQGYVKRSYSYPFALCKDSPAPLLVRLTGLAISSFGSTPHGHLFSWDIIKTPRVGKQSS